MSNFHFLPHGKRIHHLNFNRLTKTVKKITEMLACTTELAEDKIRTLQAFRSGLLTFSPPALDDISWPSTSQSYFEFAHAKQHHSMQDPTFLQRTLGYILGLKRPTDVLKKHNPFCPSLKNPKTGNQWYIIKSAKTPKNRIACIAIPHVAKYLS